MGPVPPPVEVPPVVWPAVPVVVEPSEEELPVAASSAAFFAASSDSFDRLRAAASPSATLLELTRETRALKPPKTQGK